MEGCHGRAEHTLPRSPLHSGQQGGGSHSSGMKGHSLLDGLQCNLRVPQNSGGGVRPQNKVHWCELVCSGSHHLLSMSQIQREIPGTRCSETGIPAGSHGEVKGRHQNKAFPHTQHPSHTPHSQLPRIFPLFSSLASPLLRQTTTALPLLAAL